MALKFILNILLTVSEVDPRICPSCSLGKYYPLDMLRYERQFKLKPL